jgi:signal transduction histidine kinase
MFAFDQMAETLQQREVASRQAEGRLKESRQRLQGLCRRLVEGQETERRRLARELHDEIGQSLTVAELNLQAVLQSLGAHALAPRLKESLQVVERVQQQLHDLSLNLRPSMLDDLGLEAALRWYTGRQAVLGGLRAEVRADPLEQRPDPRLETECFRVAQEALTNVVKHAKAHTVTVELSKNDDDEQLHLSVRDDGVGFDAASVRAQAVRGAGLGLLSMEERATLAGGGLEYDSTPGQGTEVHAWFPLRWARPAVSTGEI